jgi:phosphoglycerate dehydrogenase-like enzyme
MKIACTINISDHSRDAILKACPEAELIFPATTVERGNIYMPIIVDPVMKDCEVLLGHVNPRGLAESAPNLKWVHLAGAGVDHVLRSDLLERRPIVLTNSSGTTAPWMAEYVIGAILQHSRAFNASLRRQMNRRWSHLEIRGMCQPLRGKMLGIIGYGSIGRAVARLAEPFGMEVLALKRDPSDHRDHGWSAPGMGDPDGSVPRRWFGPDDVLDFIALSDFIVMAPPLTATTRHMVGAREFAAARPTAYLINVARGEVIDQNALIEALRAGRLSGDCLDVTEPEPLDPESPLWEMENVTLTFHTSAARPTAILYDFACDLFAENLKRFTSGRELTNVIDPERGY